MDVVEKARICYYTDQQQHTLTASRRRNFVAHVFALRSHDDMSARGALDSSTHCIGDLEYPRECFGIFKKR